MSVTFNIDQNDLKDAIGNVKAYQLNTRRRIRKQVATSALKIQRTYKENVPVNKEVGQGGRLRSSIKILFRVDRLGAMVWTNVEYAPYVEFGTGQFVEVPQGLEEFAWQFKGEKDVVGMAAQPALFPAWNTEQKNFRKQVTRILRETG